MDKYAREARLKPALLVALPLGIAAVALFPSSFPGWGLLWGLVVWSGGTALLAQLGRDRGLGKEPWLFEQWGGTPTTRALRHRDAPNKIVLERRHMKLQKFAGVRMPTLEEERADPLGADRVYEACTAFLKEKTRDNRLVLEENCNYGYRRNLFGMRSIGIATSLMGMSAIAVLVSINRYSTHTATEPVVYVAGALDALLLLVFGVLVNPGSVRIAAEAYAERLLSGCDNL